MRDLTATRGQGADGISSAVPPGRQAPRAAVHLAGIGEQMFAATASNASSIPTMCAFQAPSTMLVHGPRRLVGAVVASTVSCHSNVDLQRRRSVPSMRRAP